MEPFKDHIQKPAVVAAEPTTKDQDLTTEDQDPSASKPRQKLRSIHCKFQSGGVFRPPADRDNFIGFRPHYVFFYGSLMDPVHLRKVLQLENLPVLEPASIVGWKLMLWGPYPALVFKASNVVTEMAFKVTKEEHVEYLKLYETEAYDFRPSKIKMADGQVISGMTFVYDGNEDLLTEGSFDLMEWQAKQLEKQL